MFTQPAKTSLRVGARLVATMSLLLALGPLTEVNPMSVSAGSVADPALLPPADVTSVGCLPPTGEDGRLFREI
jgi:hypothetical protein